MLTPHQRTLLENHLLNQGFTSFPDVIESLPADRHLDFAIAALKFLELNGKKNENLCQLLQALRPEACKQLCEEFKAQDAELRQPLIKSGQRLGLLLRTLDPEKCVPVFEVFKHVLTSSREIGELLQYLDGEQYQALLPSLVDLINTHITDYTTYITLMTSASAMGGPAASLKIKDLNACLGSNLNLFIKSIGSLTYASDLNRCMKFLPEQARTQVYTQYRSMFVNFAERGNDDLSCVLQYLNVEQCKDVCAQIRSVSADYNPDMVLATLNPVQRAAVIDLLMEKKSLVPEKASTQPELMQIPSRFG